MSTEYYICFTIELDADTALGRGRGLDALNLRHAIQDEMESHGLRVDGGGMGATHMDIFVIGEDREATIAAGKKILGIFGLTACKVRASEF